MLIILEIEMTICFLLGLTLGIGGTYFFTRFKGALTVWKTKTEKKIEDSLKS